MNFKDKKVLVTGPARGLGKVIASEFAKPAEVVKGVWFLAAHRTELMTGAILDINDASFLRSKKNSTGL